jgi:hypothetical protein
MFKQGKKSEPSDYGYRTIDQMSDDGRLVLTGKGSGRSRHTLQTGVRSVVYVADAIAAYREAWVFINAHGFMSSRPNR